MAAALFTSVHPDDQVTTRHSGRPMTIQFGNWMVITFGISTANVTAPTIIATNVNREAPSRANRLAN